MIRRNLFSFFESRLASIFVVPHEIRFKGDIMEGTEKELKDQIFEYTRGQIKYFIHKLASQQPQEVRLDAAQEAWERVLKRLPTLDPSKGWKSYIGQQVKFAIIDFLGKGGGFEEQAFDNVHRVDLSDQDGDQEEVERIAAIFKEYHFEENTARMDWELIAKLASFHRDVHVLAKIIMGFTPLELAPRFRVSRRRILQMVDDLFERLDDPKNRASQEVNQIIAAFALGPYFHETGRKNAYGLNFIPINLLDHDSPRVAQDLYQQMLGACNELEEVHREPESLSVTMGDGKVKLFSRNEMMKNKRQKAIRERENVDQVADGQMAFA